MIDTKICNWLMDNADAPIRYRVARELLKDEKAVQKIRAELLENPNVIKWLKNLQSEVNCHGSFDNNFENAMPKLVQLGIHGGFPQIAVAVEYQIKQMVSGLGCDIVISNFIALADIDNKIINDFMLNRLDKMYQFTQKGVYDIYCSEEEKAKLKAKPQIWINRKFIKREFSHEEGYLYPFIYDIVGLHTLYSLNNTEITQKIDTVIRYISTDEFNSTIEDGYGILIASDKKYLSQGWDPKYPGWFNVADYIDKGGTRIGYGIPKLLFFAQYISKYPPARKTKWFKDLLGYLEKYKIGNGTYIFPKEWLNESQGYAVQGHHISFGENKRKKNWAKIESTFYMQLLHQNI